MSYWFYQISQEIWEPERFRVEIWENERWSWSVPTLRGGGEPQPGDSVAFFYAKAHGADPRLLAGRSYLNITKRMTTIRPSTSVPLPRQII